MEKETRNAIQSATQKARRVLEDDFREQLEGVYDIHEDGTIAAKAGPHLSAREHRQRDRIVAAIEHKRAASMRADDAVRDYLRDAAFTTLNRFVALKMLEAREIVQECISKGDASSGFAEFSGLAPGIKIPDGSGYRLYLECVFDELSTEVKVLFDRRDPSAVLWPKRATFEALLSILNVPELSGVWGEDETIGWVYQFFNGQDERRRMREESQAPRNSRELAVRNQFFTPRYVVQFLSDNTLGRIWYEMRDGDTRLKDLCEYMVRQPGEDWQPRAKKDPRDMRVLDPACGSGHFLLYCFDLLIVMYEEAWGDESSPASEVTGKTLREDYPELADLKAALPGLILRHNLHGVDIDPRCAQIGQLALWMRAQRAFKDFGIGRAERPIITRANIVIAEPMPGEKDLLKEFLAELKEDKLEGLIRRALDVPADKRVRATKAMADSLADLVETVWDGMKLAGEMGTLLKIERDLARAIDKGRAEWEDTLPLFRVADYGLGGITNEKLVRVVPGAQEDFWTKAEKLVFQALADYAAAASGSGNARRRLFAEDAAQGFALADLVAKKFDVVLMNPPFGLGCVHAKPYFEKTYPRTKNDIYAAIVERGVDLMCKGGRLGAITPRSFIYQLDFINQRRDWLIPHINMPHLVELGFGELDEASNRTAAYILERRTEFVQPCKYANLSNDPEKAGSLKVLCDRGEGWTSANLAEAADPYTTALLFRMTSELRARLAEYPRLDPVLGKAHKGARTGVVQLVNGLQCPEDGRYVRLHVEVRPEDVAAKWLPFLKPIGFSPYVGEIACVVNWRKTGAEQKADFSGAGISPSKYISGESFYPSVGVWFPDVSERGMAASLIPYQAIPGRKALLASIPGDASFTAEALAGFLNSIWAEGLIGIITPERHHKPSYVGQIPWIPGAAAEAERHFRRMVELISREAPSEVSPMFRLPDVVRAGCGSLAEAATLLREQWASTQRDLAIEIEKFDAEILRLIGATSNDEALLREMSQRGPPSAWFPTEHDLAQELMPQLSVDALSFAMGRAFGEYPKLEKTDRVTHLRTRACDSFPKSERGAQFAILADDAGHSNDIIAALEAMFSEDWRDSEKVLEEAASALSPVEPSIRSWVSTRFFDIHLSRFTKSRRKAPIYWQLATPSANYSVWLYIHAFTKDTLFRVQNDYVSGKLAHEERQLETLRAEAGPDPIAAQRKAIEAQEAFVDELRDFFNEVKRVAPLWNPNLDDGVVINFAPLWRLVPHHKPWQKELKSTWDALCTGKYDWAHLAMHLWPERVVPKCAEDRSLAIAHDLEDVFWYQDDDEKWKPREEPTRPIDALVKERTSSAVKAALKSLMEAPEQSGGARRGRGRRA